MPITAKFKAAQKKAANARKRKRMTTTTSKAITRQITSALTRAAESKFVDTLINAKYQPGGLGQFRIPAPTNVNNGMYLLNYVNEGSANYNRDGTKISIQSIRTKLVFFVNHAMGYNQQPKSVGNHIRFVIFWDKDSSAAEPTFDEVFGGQSQSGAQLTGMLMPIKPNRQQRFRVLHDEIITSTAPFQAPVTQIDSITVPPPPPQNYINNYGYQTVPTTDGSFVIDRITRDVFIDCSKKNLQTRFNGANPLPSPSLIENGALYMALAAAQDGMTLSWVATSADSFVRVRYTDI